MQPMYATVITHRWRLVDRPTSRPTPASERRRPSNTPAHRTPGIRCCEQLV